MINDMTQAGRYWPIINAPSPDGQLVVMESVDKLSTAEKMSGRWRDMLNLEHQLLYNGLISPGNEDTWTE